MKVIHICFRVTDLDKSIAFYQNAFGYRETRRKDYPGDFTLVYLADEDGLEIELTYNYGVESYEIGNGYSHFAVETEDLAAAREKHMELGYKVTEIGGLSKTSTKFYFVTDPDGYDIEVMEKSDDE